MTLPSDDIHTLVIRTVSGEPILTGDFRLMVEQGLRTLPARYPGLKVVSHAIRPEAVELVLDFRRLDEDVQRVVQSLKSEIKSLARKKDHAIGNFWQWSFEEL